VTAGANRTERDGEDCSLTFGVTRQILRAQAVTDFGIAAERSRAAAGNISKEKIEGRVLVERSCIGETAFDSIGVGGETLA